MIHSTSGPTCFRALAFLLVLGSSSLALPASAAGRICIDNDVVQFGNRFVGTTTIASVAVTNCGDQALTFTDVSVHPATGAAFQVSSKCATGLMLAPGDNCAASVAFSPLVTGQTSGGLWLRATTNVADELFTFYGRGIDAQAGTASIDFLPTSAALGTQLLNARSTGLRVEVHNPGPAVLIPTRFVLNGPAAYDFVAELNTCRVGTPIPAGEGCFVVIYFQPQTAGPRLANLVIDSPQLASLAILQISGVGTTTVGPQKVGVVEYYNAAQDRYFMTALAQEIEALDNGVFAGWTRTGYSFAAYVSAAQGFAPVCRFYIPPGYGDSHFYSASPAECADVLGRYPFFAYESPNAFYIGLPDSASGSCAMGTAPVYRVWDHRSDANHRYTTSTSVVDEMRALGWIPEGYGPGPYYPIMCEPQ